MGGPFLARSVREKRGLRLCLRRCLGKECDPPVPPITVSRRAQPECSEAELRRSRSTPTLEKLPPLSGRRPTLVVPSPPSLRLLAVSVSRLQTATPPGFHRHRSSVHDSASTHPYPPSDRNCCESPFPTSAALPSTARDDARYASSFAP